MIMGHTDGTQTDSKPMAQNHLLRRGTRYFFRRRVPDELRPIIGRKEIKKALGTSDHREAGKLARIEALKTDELFASKRREVQQVAPHETRRRIGYSESVLLVAGWYRQLEESSDEWLEENLDLFQKPDELREALETCYLDEHVFSGGGELGLGRRYQGETGRRKLMEILSHSGVEFSGTDDELKKLAALVRKGYLENARNDIKRLNREPISIGDQIFSSPIKENSQAFLFPTVQPIGHPPFNGATVGAVLDEFMKEHEAKGRAGATIRTYSVPVRFLRETLGENTLLANVTRDRMKEIRELILTLPAHAKKLYPNKPLMECIELAKKEGRSPIEKKTSDNYLRNIQAIFNYATKTRKIPFNPIADELFRGNSKPGKKPRAQFQIEQLNRIFSSPLFHSPKSGVRLGRFWVPLIGLFQGTRLNETCQLYTEDVFEKDGVWCIEINDTRKDGTACDKRLKTATSRRIVPVHPQLLKIGFADFVRQRRLDHKSPRLFPDMEPGQTGYFSDPVQKWFGRLLTQILGTKPTATFHSFRHMWKDAMTEANVPDGIAKRLGGWSNDTSAAAGYGQGPSPKALLAAIQKIQFEGLRLEHLFPPASKRQ